ncbi:MAG: hypothetical protein ACRELY_16050 [Polyangiaceae bacterium]
MLHTEKGTGNNLQPVPGPEVQSLQAMEAYLEKVTGASNFMASPKSMPCKR